MKPSLPLLLLSIILGSCKEQTETQDTQADTLQKITFAGPATDGGMQVSQYVRRMLQDRDGNIWFGTTSDGVCRYDGKSFVYFTPADGLAGICIRAMMQDSKGDIWFATNFGVSHYDGKAFTSFTPKEGLGNNDTWSIIEDRNDMIWIGLWVVFSATMARLLLSSRFLPSKVKNRGV